MNLESEVRITALTAKEPKEGRSRGTVVLTVELAVTGEDGAALLRSLGEPLVMTLASKQPSLFDLPPAPDVEKQTEPTPMEEAITQLTRDVEEQPARVGQQ